MKKRGFMAALAIGAGIMTFTGSQAVAANKAQCPKMKNCPMQATVSKLECANSSYFMVADTKMLKPQLNSMLQKFVAQFPAQQAMQAHMVIGLVSQVCDLAGISDINSIGQSSTVLVPAAPGRDVIFHNRLVAMADPAGKTPLIFQLTKGEEIKLADFAASVPGDAVSAATVSLDFSTVLKAIKEQKIFPIPPQALDSIKQELGLSAEELAASLTGRISVIVMNFDPAGKNVQIVLSVTDRGNKVYSLIARSMGVDPAANNKLAVPDPTMPLEVVKGKDAMTIYIGKGTAAALQQKIAAGQTVAKDPAFALYSGKIPAVAHGYGLGMLEFNKKGLANVTAYKYEQNVFVYYNNCNYDWNGMPFAFMLNLVSPFANNPDAAKLFKALPDML